MSATYTRQTLEETPARVLSLLSAIGTSKPIRTALATRGFGDAEFAEVADIIATALKPGFDDEVQARLRERVTALAEQFPLYPNLDAGASETTDPSDGDQ